MSKKVLTAEAEWMTVAALIGEAAKGFKQATEEFAKGLAIKPLVTIPNQSKHLGLFLVINGKSFAVSDPSNRVPIRLCPFTL